MTRSLILSLTFVLAMWPAFPWAEAVPLFAGGGAPLIASRGAVVVAQPLTPGSLFAGGGQGSFFAPLPPRLPDNLFAPPPGTTPVARIRDIIAKAEAGRKGYDAVQYGARIPTPAPPTDMTIAEIFQWIKATPGQPHAIGRYQFIPATLRRLVREAGLPSSARFSPEVQDRLADILLQDAGLAAFQEGLMPRETFMRNLAKIWAGLPLPNGKSYYHDYAGNKATMSWASFDTAMADIFADRP